MERSNLRLADAWTCLVENPASGSPGAARTCCLTEPLPGSPPGPGQLSGVRVHVAARLHPCTKGRTCEITRGQAGT